MKRLLHSSIQIPAVLLMMTLASVAGAHSPATSAFDRYGDISFRNEKARLDNFAIQLLNYPTATGYIHMSAGQVTYKNETRERLARAKAYLVKVRGLDPNRVVTIDCGFTPDLYIVLWIAPLGVTPPVCGNSTNIPLAEVKFTKPRPKTSKKRR